MKSIFWDTNLFIYLLEPNEEFSPMTKELRIKMLRRAVMDVLSDESPAGSEPQSADSQTGFGDGAAANTFGEKAADDWNSQDRNPQV